MKSNEKRSNLVNIFIFLELFIDSFIHLLQIIVNAILIPSSNATTANVFPFCGNAISTTIAGTIRTNPRIFAAIRIVPPVGAVVPAMPIIVVFPNGYFVTVKTIVVTGLTN